VGSARSLTALLELADHEVRCVQDSDAAIQAGRDLHPDAKVLDIAMPGLDGHALCRKVRSEPWGQRCLLVTVSGCGQPGDLARSREAGFDHHLVKPVSIEALQTLL
jgi:CheY-like chemotaxis protein